MLYVQEFEVEFLYTTKILYAAYNPETITLRIYFQQENELIDYPDTPYSVFEQLVNSSSPDDEYDTLIDSGDIENPGRLVDDTTGLAFVTEVMVLA